MIKSLFKPKQTQKELITEIHNAFDSAQDRLLQQANEVLNEIKIPEISDEENKADRLSAIGFTNSKPVNNVLKLKQERKENASVLVKTREEAELINYYKTTYPFLKFLTEAELDRICGKYNLIYAPVGNYIEDVPDKNLAEIERAQKLKNSDVFRQRFIVKVKKSNILNSVPGHIKKQMIDGFIIYSNDRYLPSDIQSLTKLAFGIEERITNYYHSDWSYELVDKKGLFIAAPSSHFNLKGLTKKSEFSFFNTTLVVKDDPIVFRYVNGGIQVLSKWGLEASDEALINPVEN